MITCFLIGNGPIAVQAAEVILHAGYILCGTYSFDDSLLLWSKEQGVKYYIDLEDINSSLKSSPYDCLFSINNPWIIPADIISCARRHTINYHDSLLPKYSGLYASSWALIKGEEVHGLSFHEVVETIDAGDIYQQATINISNNDTAISLNARIHKVAIESFADLLNKISNNALQPIIQDKSQRSYYSNTDRPEAACVLSVNKTAIELHNLVRGLTFGQSNNPLGLPKLLLPHKLITIGQLNITDGDGIPGEVIDVENNYLKIAVADAVVELKGIRTVFGHSVTAQQLQEWGANKGRILSGLTTVERFAITQYNRLVCVHESKWVSRLIHLNPFVHPYCKASGGLSLPSSNVVEFSPPEDFGFNKNEWITVFVIYCLRLSQEKSIQLGLAVIDIPDKAHEIFAGVVPLSISIDGIDEPVLFEDMKS
ncbi:MAG: methionyl-tRNA formyltransferase, partial [Cellvibrionaceae bacterium]